MFGCSFKACYKFTKVLSQRENAAIFWIISRPLESQKLLDVNFCESYEKEQK